MQQLSQMTIMLIYWFENNFKSDKDDITHQWIWLSYDSFAIYWATVHQRLKVNSCSLFPIYHWRFLHDLRYYLFMLTLRTKCKEYGILKSHERPIIYINQIIAVTPLLNQRTNKYSPNTTLKLTLINWCRFSDIRIIENVY